MSRLDFRSKKEIDKTKKYILDEVKHNDLLSEIYVKTCKLNTCLF